MGDATGLGLALSFARRHLLAAWSDVPDERFTTRTHCRRRDHQLHGPDLRDHDRMACLRRGAGDSIASGNGPRRCRRLNECDVRSPPKSTRSSRGYRRVSVLSMPKIRAAIITVSDTRTSDTDLSGDKLAGLLTS